MSAHRKHGLLKFCWWTTLALPVIFGLMILSVSSSGPAEPPPPTSVPFYFRGFNGVNNNFGGGWARTLGVGWERIPFSWGQVEPQKGHWDWSTTDKIAQAALSGNFTVLPDLGYTAPWAKSATLNIFAPPTNVADWMEFVNQVVSRYSAAPYNIRYFQVWNEPTLQAKFWRGNSNMSFIDQVYLPAAKVIRQHHCYVVFGGWPDGNSLQEFSSELSHNNAWQWTDILDVHYLNAWAWRSLYNNWIKNGKCKGVWQTEVGFSSAPNALPLLYLPSLAFALSTGVNNPDEFKLFWYAGPGSGPDANNCIISTNPHGGALTQHGVRLKVLNELLGTGPLSSYTQFSAQPGLSYESLNGSNSAYGFQVGENRSVVALILNKAHFASVSVVNVALTLSRRPTSISMVAVTGQRQTPKSQFTGNQLRVQVPVKALGSDCPTCANTVGYIEADY
ncbi:MAG: hypothetical protein ACRD3T_02510 [Terriglobia bacterium]